MQTIQNNALSNKTDTAYSNEIIDLDNDSVSLIEKNNAKTTIKKINNKSIKIYNFSNDILPIRERKSNIEKYISFYQVNKSKEESRTEIIHIYENNISSNNVSKAVKDKEELSQKYKKLGIIIDNSKSQKDILNFTKTIDNFKNLINTQKNILNDIPSYVSKNDMMEAFSKDSKKNIDEISEFFDIFMDFFSNPPSKEAFELINYSTIINKALIDFNSYGEELKNINEKISNRIEKLHLDEQFDKNEQIFKDSLNKLENFSKTTETKINTLSEKYQTFLNNLFETQKNQIDNIGKESNKVIKSYNDFLNKNVKSLKGGYWTLFLVNIVLSIVLGVLVALVFSQKKELDSFISISNKLDNVKLTQKGNKIFFEFPQNIKVVDKNNVKLVILE